MKWLRSCEPQGDFIDHLEVSFPDDTTVFLRSAMNPRDSITIDVWAWERFVLAVKDGYFNSYVDSDKIQEMTQHEESENTTTTSHS